MVRINGQEEAADGMRLKDYLEQNDYPIDGIAVECNEQIVSKSRYESFVLQDGDVIEIVSFVGGG
ncbi:MAG: sulfur carrier protein ThiS [Eubacterium sp.]|nr:sulfur carrier protein ThiS [Eubacterium sp.]